MLKVQPALIFDNYPKSLIYSESSARDNEMICPLNRFL